MISSFLSCIFLLFFVIFSSKVLCFCFKVNILILTLSIPGDRIDPPKKNLLTLPRIFSRKIWTWNVLCNTVRIEIYLGTFMQNFRTKFEFRTSQIDDFLKVVLAIIREPGIERVNVEETIFIYSNIDNLVRPMVPFIFCIVSVI